MSRGGNWDLMAEALPLNLVSFPCPRDGRGWDAQCPAVTASMSSVSPRSRPVREQSMSSPEPGNHHGHGQSMTDWLRSRRAGNDDAVDTLETRFAGRHHLLTKSFGEKVERSGAAKSDYKFVASCRFCSSKSIAFCRSKLSLLVA